MNPSLFAFFISTAAVVLFCTVIAIVRQFFIKKENKDITIPYNNMQTPQYSVCKKIKEYNAEF